MSRRSSALTDLRLAALMDAEVPALTVGFPEGEPVRSDSVRAFLFGRAKEVSRSLRLAAESGHLRVSVVLLEASSSFSLREGAAAAVEAELSRSMWAMGRWLIWAIRVSKAEPMQQSLSRQSTVYARRSVWCTLRHSPVAIETEWGHAKRTFLGVLRSEPH